MIEPCTSFSTQKKGAPNLVLYGFSGFKHLYRCMEAVF
jgi:hypothetical protein